jgi:hypothetical protein
VIKILSSFEQVAGRFDPVVLLVSGLVLVALGLLVWLAGMCLRRLVLAVVVGAAGGTAGWLIHGPSPAVAGLAAGGGAVLGAVLPRLSVSVLLAAIGVSIAFVILTQPHGVPERETLFGRPGAEPGDRKLTVPESLDALRTFALDLADGTRSAARGLMLVDAVILAAVGVGLLFMGWLLGRLAAALVFSGSGTALIFTGLAVLLIFKGSAPIALVQKQPAAYGLVFLGMTAFGTLEQFVLCPGPKKKRDAEAGKARPKQGEAEHGWRNR